METSEATGVLSGNSDTSPIPLPSEGTEVQRGSRTPETQIGLLSPSRAHPLQLKAKFSTHTPLSCF